MRLVAGSGGGALIVCRAKCGQNRLPDDGSDRHWKDLPGTAMGVLGARDELAVAICCERMVSSALVVLAGSTALEAAGLHLLREYSKRGSPVLEFNDFELVELLQGFT